MDALDAPGARPDRNHCMPRKELGAALWACLNLVTLHWIVYIFQLDITEEDCFSLFPLETLVYLTPDSEHGMFFMHSLLLALYFVIPGVRICESQPWCIQGEKGVNTACTPLRTQTSLDACLSGHVRVAARIWGPHPQVGPVSYLVVLLSFPGRLLALTLFGSMLDKYFFPENYLFHVIFSFIKLISVVVF